MKENHPLPLWLGDLNVVMGEPRRGDTIAYGRHDSSPKQCKQGSEREISEEKERNRG